jgi:uncharacterized damage-inducible protein DinB
MVIQALKELFTRDLNKLRQEIELYKEDSTLWTTENSIKNSGGNLCLHIVGNLKTYIGNGLAQMGYVRNRELEFSAKFVERIDIYKQIDETIQIVNRGLSQITDEELNANFPIVIWEKETGMAFTLMHLYAHLNYHLGQINYHRRVLEKSAS